MRILVVGGCGYIGPHVVRRLQEAGHDVVVLDDLSMGHPAACVQADFVRGDVRDKDVVRGVTHRTDAIIHLAALPDATRSLAEPGLTFSVNVEGSRVLLEAATANAVRHFVFSSSCAVYGTPSALPVRESEPVRPVSPYGESKATVERMLPWFERAGGPAWVSLRCANAAGADPANELGQITFTSPNLVPRVMMALTGRLASVEILGTDYPTSDGTAVRDYVHVIDLADAHVRAIEHLARGGTSVACNVGTGRGASVRDILALAAQVAGRPVPVVERPRRAGDPAEVRVAADLARHLLGWEPRFTLDEIISSAWQWHSTHPDGY